MALRGLLPEIDVAASELDVHRDIAGVIINSGEEFSSCSRYSFEFIEANGLCTSETKALRGLGRL